ncbi:S-layer homology domain-containing protein [Agathobaculum sp.]|uniref:S-layer homology domain-containing protein n=1 Tax=Agathobaculum sp. TaxID=2048138 RepID=UPI002A81B94E|nr:S-layer homology domain-containing protein [Agathobaculum sp.]MDY3617781.1 S-layer homology domain-containing protein [Agathobaculum sp.]
MKQRILSFILALSFCLTAAPSASAAMENFTSQRSYNNTFTDVPSTAWYAPYFAKTYELGLVNGTSQTKFSPQNNITLAQTIALAARIHAKYHGNDIPTANGAWYTPYVAYAVTNDIIVPDYLTAADLDNQMATRLSFAWMMVNALPAKEFADINQIEEDEIPDLPLSVEGAFSVYAMYEAGILTGNDAYGTFEPYSYISRAEVATVISRMIEPSLRKVFTLQATPRLVGYEGEYFSSAGDPVRTWIGCYLNIFSITSSQMLFDFQYEKAGHAVLFTAEPATFTSPTTATGYGTFAWGDQPQNASPVRYEFVFSNYNIHLDVYLADSEQPGYEIDYTCNGTIQI